MAKIRALFWDVGGVLLSNAWDHNERQRAAQKFGLDWNDFRERHDLIVGSLEEGRMDFDDYLERVVFHQPRSFGQEEFKQYVLSLSTPKPETLELARHLANCNHCVMATINNESRALNEYRIQHFGLQEIFSHFVSSCFTHLRKPDPAIYRLALNLTQRKPEESCFIDDRALNLEEAARVGMHTIHFRNAEQLRRDLITLGVEIAPLAHTST
ncbi:MAG TPA: HAD family phosphatase [Terriglobales bacterium]|nr:HAD family phosphatase [Terriglobales bacterium]